MTLLVGLGRAGCANCQRPHDRTAGVAAARTRPRSIGRRQPGRPPSTAPAAPPTAHPTPSKRLRLRGFPQPERAPLAGTGCT
jgi:hypothetical protein